MKTRVLFVCLGNICRSPMAEGIFRKHVEAQRLDKHFLIDSAGTAAYHVGERADPRTRATLVGHGARYDGRARQVQDADFVDFDHILAMDRSNLRDLHRRCPPEHAHKLVLALGDEEVPDPYYGGPDGFEHNYQQLDQALTSWLALHHGGADG